MDFNTFALSINGKVPQESLLGLKSSFDSASDEKKQGLLVALNSLKSPKVALALSIFLPGIDRFYKGDWGAWAFKNFTADFASFSCGCYVFG